MYTSGFEENDSDGLGPEDQGSPSLVTRLSFQFAARLQLPAYLHNYAFPFKRGHASVKHSVFTQRTNE
jgi:hypothetical protein